MVNYPKIALELKFTGLLEDVQQTPQGMIARIKITASPESEEESWVECLITSYWKDIFIQLQNELLIDNYVMVKCIGFYQGMHHHACTDPKEKTKDLTVYRVQLTKLIEKYINGQGLEKYARCCLLNPSA